MHVVIRCKKRVKKGEKKRHDVDNNVLLRMRWEIFSITSNMLDPLHLGTSILDTLKNLLKYSIEKLKNTFSFQIQLQLNFAVAATVRRNEKNSLLKFLANIFRLGCLSSSQLT